MRFQSFAQIPLRELDVIYEIAAQAVELYHDMFDEVHHESSANITEKNDTLLEVFLSIATCHAFCCPLRLVELRDARADNFVHDVRGIRKYLDPKKRTLSGFLPLHAAALEAAL